MTLDFENLRRSLRSALMADVLDGMGRRHQCLGPGIVPLRSADILVGRAFPVTVIETDTPIEPPYQGLLRALDAIAADDVFVYPTGRSSRAAVWGELVSTACLARGAAGALTDGLVRDTERIRALGFPVFARGTLPLDVNGRLEVVGYGADAVLDGVPIRPGDLIVADADGVVIVPSELEAEAVELALAKGTREAGFRSAVAAGTAPSVAFDRFKVL
jgi:4-hydroxy-4-methyl-2-oxoglutarate aldolase